MKTVAMKNKRVSVSVVDESGRADRDGLLLIKSCARKAARLLSLEGELTVAVFDDAGMRDLNRRYRNVSRTTDVLAFEQGGEGGLIGDVAISLETARRRAALHGVTFSEEIKRLVIHGIAHLAGHTHKKKKEGERMRAEESRILRAVSGL